MITVIYVNLGMNDSRPVDMNKASRELEARMAVLREQEKQTEELNELIRKGWQILHTGQITVKHSHGETMQAVFVVHRADRGEVDVVNHRD